MISNLPLFSTIENNYLGYWCVKILKEKSLLITILGDMNPVSWIDSLITNKITLPWEK